jgi:hypothetical protein
MTSAPAANEPMWPDDDVPTDELVRRSGVTPIRSTEDLDDLAHPDLWDSEADYEAFLADLYAARRAHVG